MCATSSHQTTRQMQHRGTIAPYGHDWAIPDFRQSSKSRRGGDDFEPTIFVWPKGKKQKLNSHRKSAAMEPHKPLPLWLTTHRSRPALRAPIWTRLLRALLRALRGSTQRPAARPMPWHHELTGNSQAIQLPGEDSPKLKGD
jgi:hypothetical protein